MPRSLYGLSPGLLFAIVIHGAVAPFVLLSAPAVATQYAAQMGLGAGQVGLLFSIELAAMSLATIPGYYWQKHWDWRVVGFFASLLFIIANIASAFIPAFAPLLALRFFSALGGGTLMIMGLASVMLSPARERVYGLWVCGQLVLGAIGLWILPGFFTKLGLPVLYIGLAALMTVAIPLVRFYPPNLKNRPTVASARNSGGGRTWAMVGIVGLMAFYIGLSGVWTFIGSIAEASGIGPENTGQLLSIATILGIGGSLTATALGGRVPRSLSLTVGYVVMTGSILLLIGTPQIVRFAAAAFAFKFVWTFALPFILGTVSDQDKDGRLMNTANLAIGGGLALGPAIAGKLLENGGFSKMLGFSAMFTAFSFLAIIISHFAHSRTTATGEPGT